MLGLQEFTAVLLANDPDGHNLFPLTEDVPSALLPVANRPLITYQLELLHNAKSFHSVILVVDETHEKKFKAFAEAEQKATLKIILKTVPQGTGSADALRMIKDEITTDVLLIAADTVCDVPFQQLADLHRQQEAACTVLFKEEAPRAPTDKKKARDLDGADFIGLDASRERLIYLESAADCDGGVATISASMLRAYPHLKIHTGFMDAHIYILAKWTLSVLDSKPHFGSVKFELLPYLVRKQFLSHANLAIPAPQSECVPLDYHPASTKAGAPLDARVGFRCCCYVVAHDAGYCARAGKSLQAYMQINLDISRGGATHFEKAHIPADTEVTEGNPTPRAFSSDSARGAGVEVGARSSIKKSCIGPNCRIGSGTRLTNCVVMEGAVIGNKVTMSNCIVCPRVEIGDGASLKDAQVGSGVAVEGNAVIKGEALTVASDEAQDFW